MTGRNHRRLDYKTHVLVGVRSDDWMTVIANWPSVPHQSEVQRKIEGANNDYVTYMLCTPTSIMPAEDDASGKSKREGSQRTV